MKAIIFVFALTVIPSCMKQSAQPVRYEEYMYSGTNEDTTDTPLKRAEEALNMTDGIEERLAVTYHDVDSLRSQNKKLRSELKGAIDSLKEAKKQLEVIRMVPKKRNLIQKVFNITPDSIQVKDTIKY